MESAASLSARCIAGRRARPSHRPRLAAAQAAGAPRREEQPPRRLRRVVALTSDGETTRASAEAYNRAMQAYSQSPFMYQHEAGLYYHEVDTNLFVGTQPQTPADIDRLRDEEGITCIMNTQQDKDMVHWKVDFSALQRRCTERGVLMSRHPFPDFSAEGLRSGLPAAVSSLDGLLEAGHRVYLHCTAGMGRSPGVAIAYMYWFRGYATLDEAYLALTTKRPCGPNKEAIRGATCDLLAAQGPLFVLPPPPAQGSTWPEGKGATLTDEERTSLQRRLRACRPVIIRPDGTQLYSSAWPLPAAFGVIASLLAKLGAANAAAVAAAESSTDDK